MKIEIFRWIWFSAACHRQNYFSFFDTHFLVQFSPAHPSLLIGLYIHETIDEVPPVASLRFW